MTDTEDKAPGARFAGFSNRDAADLIAEYPLAWVVPRSGAALPGLLPLLAEYGPAGELVALLGHMSRRNPLAHAFAQDPRATILFTGPQAPLPTALVSDPRWAPTWAYAQLTITARLCLVPDETAAAVHRLTRHIEDQAGTSWEPEMVGPRYAAMMGAIVAFRLSVDTIGGRFKLGQDETPQGLGEIVAGVGDPALVRWIERFNAGRGQG